MFDCLLDELGEAEILWVTSAPCMKFENEIS